MDNMPELTERQKAALRGELTLAEWDAIGMELFRLGIVGIDPLADMCGGKSAYVLTELGRKVARELR